MDKKGFKLNSVILIIVCTSLLSAVSVGLVLNKNYTLETGVSCAELYEDEDLIEFLTIYSLTAFKTFSLVIFFSSLYLVKCYIFIPIFTHTFNLI